MKTELDNTMEIKPGARWWWVGVGLVVVAGLVVAGLGLRTMDWGYNVRELLGSDWRTAMKALLVMGVCGLAMLTLGAWAALPGRHIGEHGWRKFERVWVESMAAAGVLGLGGFGLAVMLEWGLPTESLHDVVGRPITGWSWRGETVVRLAALLVIIMAAAMIGYRSLNMLVKQRPVSWLRSMSLLVAAVEMSLVGWAIVVIAAATDNVTELLSHQGSFMDCASVSLVICGWAMSGASLGYFVHRCAQTIAGRMDGRSRQREHTSTPEAEHLPLTMVAGRSGLHVHQARQRWHSWGVLTLGLCGLWLSMSMLGSALADEVTKYGVTFSAEQFLLGGERVATVSAWELQLRWVMVHAGMVIVMMLGHWGGPWLQRAIHEAGKSMGTLPRAREAKQPPTKSEQPLKRAG